MFKTGSVALGKGEVFVLDADPAPGDTTRVHLPHPEIFAAVEPGHHLLLDDGKVKLTATEVDQDHIVNGRGGPQPLQCVRGIHCPLYVPAATSENATRAGVEIAVNQRRLADLSPDPGGGLMACNLPYGVRIAADARTLFDELAAAAHRRSAWRVAIVAASARGASGLRLTTLLRTKSGGIPIEMLVSA